MSMRDQENYDVAKERALQEKLDIATALLVKLRDVTPDHYPELLDEIDKFLDPMH